MAGRIGLVVEWPDPHHPYVDIKAMEAVYQFAEHWQPDDHVLMGDNLNNGGITRHVQDDLIAQYEEPMIEGLLSFGLVASLWAAAGFLAKASAREYASMAICLRIRAILFSQLSAKSSASSEQWG